MFPRFVRSNTFQLLETDSNLLIHTGISDQKTSMAGEQIINMGVAQGGADLMELLAEMIGSVAE